MIDDPNFIDVMVQELKSQGLFDQFRKECLADVDTKPAYQNLRQRVEGTVNKFLVQQEWSDNIRYKNQLRDQLRKNIIDSGFLDTGVERIVDQVVNPKISTVFQPKVEDIVYNYLGIEKPKSSVNGNETRPELLLEDLEAVSPDSDKKSEGSVSSPPPTEIQDNTVEDMDIDDDLDESKEQDDFESPAFEPLEVRSPSKTKDDTNDSNSSAISGLTSQESVESDDRGDGPPEKPMESTNVPPSDEFENPATKDSDFSQDLPANNDSQLSQVSSNSQLLTTMGPSAEDELQRSQENERLDITEEAQMPTLFTSTAEKQSDSSEGVEVGEEAVKKKTFNFEKDEYDFVVTGRASDVMCEDDNSSINGNRPLEKEGVETPTVTPTEMPTETTTKDGQVPGFSTQDDTTSQSEHSLKICEDTFSDDDTKECSRSADTRQNVRRTPPKIKELSDASSCSFKTEPDTTSPSKPASPKEKPIEVSPKQPDEAAADERQEESKKSEDSPCNTKPPKSDTEDDHYQEHLKQNTNRRPSERDSDDSNGKSRPFGPSASSGESKSIGGNMGSAQDANDDNLKKEKSNEAEATDSLESPERQREFSRSDGSVTPSRADSSSSGIQSGDDSEKSPVTVKSFAKSESIILPVQPVVIDQMLTIVQDSQLERLLNGDTATNDATLESLQRKWQSADGNVRKPKFASNFSEARRLMKVRKQMQRDEQKCRDRTLAMAKRYITENKPFGGQMAEDQGIELEFVCDGKRKSPGPMISSPVPKVESTGDVPTTSDPDLLYFPEEKEIFQVNEAQLNYLRTKINGISFGRSFKIVHYSSKIHSLAERTAGKKATKRPAAGAIDNPQNERPNGLSKEFDITGHNDTVDFRKQRSITKSVSRRLLEKNTPPSVGTDA